MRAAAVVSVAAVLLLAGCTRADSTAVPTPTGDIPSGTVGAAQLSDGYLRVGTGGTEVSVYLDPMCPYCGQFETANGDQIQRMVAANDITLRLYPLTFLDRSSRGTEYSSRASSALTCVAASRPASTLDYLAALYANQPDENTSGLTDARLVSLAEKAGAADAASCIRGGDYVSWAQGVTSTALSDDLPGQSGPLKGTPTVIIDGTVFDGSITDADAFREAVGGSSS